MCLEDSRMLLVQPTETEAGQMKELKVAFEEAISGDLVGSRLDELLSDNRISEFERCCAVIIGCGISSEPSSKLVDKISEAYDDLDRLGGQHAPESCPLAWKNLIGKWLRLAQRVRKRVKRRPEERSNAQSTLGVIFPSVESYTTTLSDSETSESE